MQFVCSSFEVAKCALKRPERLFFVNIVDLTDWKIVYKFENRYMFRHIAIINLLYFCHEENSLSRVPAAGAFLLQ